MTEQLLTDYKQQIRHLILVPYGDGRFEVFIDGKKIYSKKTTGMFPEYAQVKKALES